MINKMIAITATSTLTNCAGHFPFPDGGIGSYGSAMPLAPLSGRLAVITNRVVVDDVRGGALCADAATCVRSMSGKSSRYVTLSGVTADRPRKVCSRSTTSEGASSGKA